MYTSAAVCVHSDVRVHIDSMYTSAAVYVYTAMCVYTSTAVYVYTATYVYTLPAVYVYTSAASTHRQRVHIGSVYTSAACTHRQRVHIGSVYTSAACTHQQRVHIGSVYTSAACTHQQRVHIGSVYTSAACTHRQRVHIGSVYTSAAVCACSLLRSHRVVRRQRPRIKIVSTRPHRVVALAAGCRSLGVRAAVDGGGGGGRGASELEGAGPHRAHVTEPLARLLSQFDLVACPAARHRLPLHPKLKHTPPHTSLTDP